MRVCTHVRYLEECSRNINNRYPLLLLLNVHIHMHVYVGCVCVCVCVCWRSVSISTYICVWVCVFNTEQVPWQTLESHVVSGMHLAGYSVLMISPRVWIYQRWLSNNKNFKTVTLRWKSKDHFYHYCVRSESAWFYWSFKCNLKEMPQLLVSRLTI